MYVNRIGIVRVKIFILSRYIYEKSIRRDLQSKYTIETTYHTTKIHQFYKYILLLQPTHLLAIR